MTNWEWADTQAGNIGKNIVQGMQTVINDVANNAQGAIDFLMTDHSTSQTLSISIFEKGKKIDTIRFSVQPQNAINFKNTTNIAVFSQPGGFPTLQAIGPGSNKISWQGVFYNSKRATSLEQQNIDKYQYDIVKKLEGWQNEGKVVTVTFGPIVVDAIIESFSYAVKRIDLIQYVIELIIDEESYIKRAGERRPNSEEFWANGSIDVYDLIGGKDSTMGKLYTGISTFTNNLTKVSDTITSRLTNITNNIVSIQRTYGDIISAPISATLDVVKSIEDTQDIITEQIDKIESYSMFGSVMNKLKGL